MSQPQGVYVEAPSRGMSVTSFVLGLVSFFFGFVFVVPIIGIIVGVIGLRREPAGRGFAIAGIWINAIVVAGWAIVAILIVGAVTVGLFSIPFLAS